MLQPQPSPDYAGAEKFMLEKLAAELSPALSYHGVHHTLDVMQAAIRIAADENISEEANSLLRVAVAFHDAGFLYSYHGHEEKGCEMAHELLPGFCFETWQIDAICSMIMSTKIPQSAQTQLEQIICDADLDYLGRADATTIAATLYEELKNRGDIKDEAEWNDIQVSFLKSHRYHTNHARQHRQQNQEAYLKSLMEE